MNVKPHVVVFFCLFVFSTTKCRGHDPYPGGNEKKPSTSTAKFWLLLKFFCTCEIVIWFAFALMLICLDCASFSARYAYCMSALKGLITKINPETFKNGFK